MDVQHINFFDMCTLKIDMSVPSEQQMRHILLKSIVSLVMVLIFIFVD